MAFEKCIKITDARCSPSREVLNDSFIKIFAPFRFLQIIFGSCRVNVKNGSVTAPTILQKCYTVICLISSFYFGVHFTLSYAKFYNDPNLIYILIIGITSLNVSFGVNTFHARFINNEGNVKLYKIMQKIDSDLKLHSENAVYSSHYRHNVIVVLALVAIYSIQFILFFLLTGNQFGAIVQVGSMWVFYSFVYELCCCSSHVLFFTKRVRIVNSMIINHFKNKHRMIETLSKRCTNKRDFESNDTDLLMKEILNGFSCFHSQYRFQVITNINLHQNILRNYVSASNKNYPIFFQVFLFCMIFISWMVVSFQYIILVLQRAESMVTVSYSSKKVEFIFWSELDMTTSKVIQNLIECLISRVSWS